VRRNREGRTFRGSRGFGFVEVEDASQQKEAVEKVEGTLIGDRKLSAKIANEMKEADAEEAAKEAQKGDAAATASPAVTSADAA
jgi:RNA recognition motif-containing protein